MVGALTDVEKERILFSEVEPLRQKVAALQRKLKPSKRSRRLRPQVSDSILGEEAGQPVEDPEMEDPITIGFSAMVDPGDE